MVFQPFRAFIRSIGQFALGLLLTYGSIFTTPALGQVKIKIMPLGDSITHGSPMYNSYRRSLWLKLQEAKYDVDFVGGLKENEGGPPPNSDFDLDHHGHWGWTTDKLVPEIWHWTRDNQPDIVLLHAGTNDCFGEKSIEGIRDNIGRIIDQLRSEQPAVKVLVAQIIPTAAPYQAVNTKITALNALLPALAAEKTTQQSPVVVVDQNTGFSSDEGVDLYDGVHPNVRGEEKIAAQWYKALRATALLGRPLPVSLVAFRARTVSAGVELTWATTSEQDNAGFTVERSVTGVEFDSVGQVAGQGTTRNPHAYTFLDVAPPASVLYYRLRQTDIDGAVTFSSIVTARNSPISPLVLSPVPAQEHLTVHGVEMNTLVMIWDMRGQLVYRQVVSATPLVLNVSQLASGLYQVQADGHRARFVKN
jgi:lysophospholipase L1-like esterase